MMEGVEETVDNLDCLLTNKCSHHNADKHAGQQLAEWTKIINFVPTQWKSKTASYLTLTNMYYCYMD